MDSELDLNMGSKFIYLGRFGGWDTGECIEIRFPGERWRGFTIAQVTGQDEAQVVVSSRKQQNMDWAVAALQGEGLSVTGTVPCGEG